MFLGIRSHDIYSSYRIDLTRARMKWFAKNTSREREGWRKRERSINGCKGRDLLISPGINRFKSPGYEKNRLYCTSWFYCMRYVYKRENSFSAMVDRYRGLSFLKYLYKMYICTDGNVSSSCILSKQRFLTIRHICTQTSNELQEIIVRFLLVSDYVWSVSDTEVLASY